MSRQHCEIVPTPNGIVVRDHGWTNGTYHGAVRLQAATFYEPFSLRVGVTTFSVSPHAGTIDLERSTADRFGDLIGISDCMREPFAGLMRLAPSDASVLIEGRRGPARSWSPTPSIAPAPAPTMPSSSSIAERWRPRSSRATSSATSAVPSFRR